MHVSYFYICDHQVTLNNIQYLIRFLWCNIFNLIRVIHISIILIIQRIIYVNIYLTIEIEYRILYIHTHSDHWSLRGLLISVICIIIKKLLLYIVSSICTRFNY